MPEPWPEPDSNPSPKPSLHPQPGAKLDAVDEKLASLEAEIASFCEEKGALLGSTEKALDEWTREIARVSQAAMDKANGAVAMLVSTIKTLKETEAQLSAAEAAV